MKRTNKKRENTRSSYETVVKLLGDNSEIVSSVAALDADMKLFTKNYSQYLMDETAFKVATEGKTSAKSLAETALVEALFPLMRGMRSFARTNNKADLFSLADVEKYELNKMRDTDLEAYAREVVKRAGENAASLVSCGVTSAELADVELKINAYAAAMKDQGGGMAAQSSAYEALKVSMKNVESVLADIDDLMERIKPTNPKFYDAYVSARKVKPLGTRHRKQPANSPAANPK